jgi:hypothetical protein
MRPVALSGIKWIPYSRERQYDEVKDESDRRIPENGCLFKVVALPR